MDEERGDFGGEEEDVGGPEGGDNDEVGEGGGFGVEEVGLRFQQVRQALDITVSKLWYTHACGLSKGSKHLG